MLIYNEHFSYSLSMYIFLHISILNIIKMNFLFLVSVLIDTEYPIQWPPPVLCVSTVAGQKVVSQGGASLLPTQLILQQTPTGLKPLEKQASIEITGWWSLL